MRVMIAVIALYFTIIPNPPAYAHSQTGNISYYWQGTKTASGERFNKYGPTCAHKWLPFGSMVRIDYGSIVVWCRVTDRGPFVKGRILDVSLGVAQRLGMTKVGVVRARITARE